MAATFHTAETVRRIALAAAAATLAASTVALAGESPKKPLTFGASPELARGKYLVAVMGCDDCHTPMKMGARGPEPDMTRRLSGHPQELKVPGVPPVDGKSWVWRLNFDYRITSFLQSTVSYLGRTEGDGPVVHTARAEVRAFF